MCQEEKVHETLNSLTFGTKHKKNPIKQATFVAVCVYKPLKERVRFLFFRNTSVQKFLLFMLTVSHPVSRHFEHAMIFTNAQALLLLIKRFRYFPDSLGRFYFLKNDNISPIFCQFNTTDYRSVIAVYYRVSVSSIRRLME